MFDAGVVLFLLMSGASTFMIHNTHHSLCLENSVPTGEVLLKRCNLDSKAQQWIWKDQWMLMAVSTSGCLSAEHSKPIQTTLCQGPEVQWDCKRNRLISKNTSLLLSADGQRLTLSHDSEHSKWSSLDAGDICQEQLRSKRASDEAHESEDIKGLTEEQKEYLHWFYRSEDSSTWVFVLLVLAFICLLVGLLLLGMGVMASKSRKKIAKYKAAAAGAQRSEAKELQVLCGSGDKSSAPQTDEQMFPSSNGNVGDLSPGNILVTWKDGNTSDLYASPAAGLELEEEGQEAEGIEQQIEGSGDLNTI
ncbi:uncharacterized protein si:cabz01068815.1 [Thalassophryne amazonica]|uniref:uncharacterized protein si:cabz01068815.1 n=1 Tax=Thalassophryne amazonica TaxID=390379 RepID=UPI001472558D|nr:uncharacterized protein si:cabz01068815.1 [Thalassophryne amazonica]